MAESAEAKSETRVEEKGRSRDKRLGLYVVTLAYILGFILIMLLLLIPSFTPVFISRVILPTKQTITLFLIYAIAGTTMYITFIMIFSARKPRVKKVLKEKEKVREEVEKPEEVKFVTASTEELTESFLELYEILPPYVYAGIVRRGDRLEYKVLEPIMTESDWEIKRKIEDILYQELKLEDSIHLDKKTAENYLKRAIDNVVKRYKFKVSKEGLEKIEYYIIRDHVYYGKIDPLMRDENIEDISCNGPNQPVYVYHRMYESIPTNIVFTEDELNDFIIRLAYISGRHVSIDTPIVDATLPDGTRIHLTFGREVSRKGSSFTIRKFRREPFTIIDLIKLETLDEQIAAFLWFAIEHNASILVAGGTASGKTTFLNAISLFIRPEKKIVSIEDTAELNLPHENWNPLVERTGFGIRGSEAEIRMFELLKAALRQRPDVIIVGEVRGEEAYTMFQAMASVSGDTPILIKNKEGKIELVSIGEFVDKYYKTNEQWVKKYINGVEALTLDKDYNIRFKPIKYVLRHKANKIYKIKYMGGGEIKTTGAHSILSISDNGEIIAKRVDELKKGDFLITFVGSSIENKDVIIDAKEILKDECISKIIMLQRENGIDEVEVLLPKSGRGKYIPRYIKIDSDLAYTFGVYLADGCIKYGKGKRICFSLGTTEANVLDRVRRALKKFNVTPSIDNRGTYIIAEFNHTILASLFEKLMGAKLENKKVPDFLWEAPTDIVKEFLNGYKCDSRRTLNRYYTSYSSLNKDLINSIIWLSRLKGYGGFISGGDGKYPSVNIYLDRVSKKETQVQRIPITPLRKLYELLKPKSMPKRYTYILRKNRKTITKWKAAEILKYILNNRTEKLTMTHKNIINNITLLISSNLGVAEVKDVKEEKTDEYVYDISIPDTELFVGGEVPIILRNTGHGGLGSIHAESIKAVVDRLTTEPMNIPKPLIPTLHLIVLLVRMRIGGRVYRKVIHIAEPYLEDGEIKFNDVFIWDAYKMEYKYMGKSRTLERIGILTGRSLEDIYEDIERRKVIIRWMVKKNIHRFMEVSEVIRNFYLNPEETYQRARLELLSMGETV